MRILRGYLQIEPRAAIPIWIHWTILLMAVIVSRFEFRPGIWLGVFFVILVHELGHAVAVIRARAVPTAIYMDGTGGRCEWFGEVTRNWRLIIASGGILAQLFLWVTAFSVDLLTGPTANYFYEDFLSVMLGWNLIVVAINLIPVSPLDGHTIWRLLPAFWRDWRRQGRAKRRQRLTAITLKRMKELERLEPQVKPRHEARDAIRLALQTAIENQKAEERNAKKNK